MSAYPFTEQDASLLTRAQTGDTRAEDAAIRRWCRYVSYLTKRFVDTNYHLSSDDLYQAGCIGLLKAIRTWRPDAGAVFNTYMHCCIWRALVKEAVYQQRYLSGGPLETVSLDAPAGFNAENAEEGGNFGDFQISTEDVERTVFAKADCKWALQALASHPKHSRAIVLRFGLDGRGERNYREIGTDLGCSSNGACYIVKSAIRRLQRVVGEG